MKRRRALFVAVLIVLGLLSTCVVMRRSSAPSRPGIHPTVPEEQGQE